MEPSPATQYSLKPLLHPSRDIRLLYLDPGRGDDPIICTTAVVPRNTDIQYAAVSYTWGEAQPTETIHIDQRAMRVRRNCWIALWQIRWNEIHMPIWIDSISIDQSNNAEKSVQVRVMGSIYAHATLTAACIGDGGELADVAREIISFERSEFDLWSFPEERDIPEDLPEIWGRLLALARLPYFKRLWIVQELYHSSNICLLGGGVSLSWDHLEPFFLAIGELASAFENSVGSLPTGYVALDETELARFIHFRKFRRAQSVLKTEWTDEITGHGFTGVLLSFGGGDCFDPRDKIYGLLSLAQDRRWLVNFPIDYDRRLSDIILDVVIRIGNESLTENVSRLIVTMLGWFSIETATDEGQILLHMLEQPQPGPIVPWNNFTDNVVAFESIRTWNVCRTSSFADVAREFKIPPSENTCVFLHSEASERNFQYLRSPFDWRQVCYERGKLIQSDEEWMWITSSEVQPGDLIVQFDALRDERDEFNVVVICRLPHRDADRLEIIENASMCVNLEAYDRIYETQNHFQQAPLYLSHTERRYIKSRMLYARPHNDRVTVHLKPTDLLKIAMLRGQVIEHIRHPVSSVSSGCYAKKEKVDLVEISKRTQTYVVERAERNEQTGEWSIVLTSSQTFGSVPDLSFQGDINRAGVDFRRIVQQMGYS